MPAEFQAHDSVRFSGWVSSAGDPPGGAQWWQYGQHFIGTEIVKYLKTELAKIDPETPSFLDFNASYRKRLAELAGVAES